MGPGRGGAAAAALVVALGVAVAGCTSAPAPAPRPAPVSSRQLDASVAQFRFDEGTRRLKAGVSNRSNRPVSVTEATIDWPPLAFPQVRLSSEPVLPGQTAAFTISYGTARCGRPVGVAPVLVATIDGATRRLPLHVDQPGQLQRLQADACAQQRLAATASVELQLATRTERIAGEEYLPADLVLRRRTGTTAPVRVVDLGGSVLIELLPRGGAAALPGVLAPGRSELRFPLLFGSGHRCDGHALGQSSQTFLMSAYLRLADRPVQRVILPLSSTERDRIYGVVQRDCAH